MKEKVCIVLVNFRGHSDTIECMESLFKSTYRNYQIIIVDNSPGEESVREILNWADGGTVHMSTKFPNLVVPYCSKPIAYQYLTETEIATNAASLQEELIVIKSSSNKGFAGGNNLAIQVALRDNQLKYVWLLNNDTVVEATTLEQLVKFGGQSEASMIGCKLLYYNNPRIVQALGGRYNCWFGRVTEIGQGELDTEREPLSFSMDYVIGASMFIKRACIEDIGLMDESFFLYFEELDWALRAKRRNWLVGYCPAKVYHKVGASTKATAKSNSALADFYYARNRILIARIYFPWTLITLYPSFIVFIFNRIKRKQFDRILMLFKILMNPRKHFVGIR